MIKWTFVRINYHYMGLPFLCMQGSLRITGRLLHIFFKPLAPDLPLSFPFCSFWEGAESSLTQSLVKDFIPAKCVHAHIFPQLLQTLKDHHFCAKNKKKTDILLVFTNSPKSATLLHFPKFLMPICLVQHTINFLSYKHWMNAKVIFQGHSN